MSFIVTDRWRISLGGVDGDRAGWSEGFHERAGGKRRCWQDIYM